jgi:signal transduction histidine kinase
MIDPSARAGNGVRIIIAEDSPTQAARLCYALERAGYTIISTVNGRQALEAAIAEKPSLIISDILMPEMNGYDLCREIKSHPALKDVPLILVTALSDPQDVIRGLECGADNFIVKPYDEGNLINRIQFVLLNHSMQRQSNGDSVEIFFDGQKHVISSGRIQILNLLLSTYETAIQRNQELAAAKDALRTANTSLEATNKELEAFSYSVSHDLRAPLRAIEGFTRSLTTDHAPQMDDTAQALLHRVAGACTRMGQLIEDLLTLSRVARSEMRHEPVDLSAAAESIVADLRTSQPERAVEVRIEPGMTATGDPRLLRAALENLLGNAWKFTSNEPVAVVEFGTLPDRQPTVFFVRDNGAGFDMNYADKLFGPFQRLHSTSEFPGTGVGLATVQRIVNRHQGSIWAEAVVEQGATFYFTLG